ncbi:hypothetical protein GQ600_25780 [Phytophthora cactorum]|nr:hypothetical protein GQ600_25780 [Phytophthora cactorum]
MWCTHGSSQESRGEGHHDYVQGSPGVKQNFTRDQRGGRRWAGQVTSVHCSRIGGELHNNCSAFVFGLRQTDFRCTDITTQAQNHKTIYDGANYMTLTPQVRQELGLLTEIKTSTADIKRYLSKRLGGYGDNSQQTRNIVRQVLGKSTIERSKVILDNFADEDSGKDDLLVQDQMDITCTIAMQTLIQKNCLKQ